MDVSQVISSFAGYEFTPATSGVDAFPTLHVRFSHGLLFELPSLDVNVVCPFPIEPTTIIERCVSPFANACWTNFVTSKFIHHEASPSLISDIIPLSLSPIAPGIDQLLTPSYVVPFALVFHGTSAG